MEIRKETTVTAGTDKIGVGVIGLQMGNSHLQGYAQNPHVRILGVCDTNESLTARRCEEYGAAVAVTDYRRLLETPGISLVSVASPDFFHAQQCIAALDAGMDVLCEKPLTLDLAEAKQIVAAVERTKRRFMIGQVCRYAPGFALARKMVDRGDVGELFLVESEYAHNYARSRGADDWRVDARREPFIGGGCHAVDLLRWIAGDAAEVFAYANHKCLPEWPVNDCLVALINFRNGVVGKAMCSIGCVRPYTMRSVFYGTEGTIVCDNTSAEIKLCSTKNYNAEPSFATFPVEISSHNVAAEISEFVDCILNDKPVATDVYEGLKTLATCRAAIESARTGRPVRIEALLRD